MDIRSAFKISAGVTGQQSIDRLSGSVGKVNDQVGRLPALANKAGRALGVALAAAPAVLFAATKSAIDYASSIVDAADQTGLGVEAFQALKFAAGQAGVAGDEFTTAMRRFTTQVGAAANGSAKQAKLFSDLGVSIRDDLTGAVRDGESILLDFSDALQRVDEPAVQARLSAELFGRGVGVKLSPFLREGSANMQAMMQQARDLGAVLSEDTARGAEKAGDDLEAVANILKVQLTKALLDLTPLITGLAQAFADAAPAIASFFQEAQDGINFYAANDSVLSQYLDKARELREFFLLTRQSDQTGLDAVQQAQGQFGTFIRPKGSQNLLGDRGLGASFRDADIRAGADAQRAAEDQASAEERADAERLDAARKRADEEKDIVQDFSDFEGAALIRRQLEYEAINDAIVADSRDAFAEMTADIEQFVEASNEEATTALQDAAIATVEIFEDQQEQMADIASSAANDIADGFERVVFARFTDGAEGMKDALVSVLAEMLLEVGRSGLRSALEELFKIDQGEGSDGGGFLKIIGQAIGAYFGGSELSKSSGSAGTGSLKEFATGGSFTVPGSGSGDNVIPIFRASPGEEVNVTPKGQRSGGSNVTVNYNVDARGADAGAAERIRSEIRMSEQRVVATIIDKVRRRQI